MNKRNPYRVVLVTAPDLKTARQLAKLALEAKLVACANLVPGLESHYWWQNKLDRSREILILFKTVRQQVSTLQELILAHHPYQTPEFVTLEIQEGSPGYLEWIAASASKT